MRNQPRELQLSKLENDRIHSIMNVAGVPPEKYDWSTVSVYIQQRNPKVLITSSGLMQDGDMSVIASVFVTYAT